MPRFSMATVAAVALSYVACWLANVTLGAPHWGIILLIVGFWVDNTRKILRGEEMPLLFARRNLLLLYVAGYLLFVLIHWK